MLNYCFKSKDELIKIAVDNIIFEEFKQYSNNYSEQPAILQLRNLLIQISKAVIKYQELTKASIPYFMLEEEIKLPLKILPFIKKYYNNQKTDVECKVIAFHIVYSLQLIFYKSEDFKEYVNIDIIDLKQLIKFIDMQLDLFLP